jgi:hypothetical protein
MSDSDLVRASRDGDQFHYLWAARRCLRLLSPQSRLVAVSIEGAATLESADPDDGNEIIDIAEYFDSEELEKAALVRYMQLKHSTLHADKPWTASGLTKTIKGFIKKQSTLKSPEILAKVEFWFVSNRSLSQVSRETIEDAAAGQGPRHADELQKLEKLAGLSGTELSQFCSRLRFDDKQDGYWEQRNLLYQDVVGYLADADVDALTQLKELVSTKALTENKEHPTITRLDVLRVLKADQDTLFPAPCLIADVPNAIRRKQEAALFEAIATAGAKPVIVHAEGGVGKSIFASHIKHGLPLGSVTILYDCFGNGQYRNALGYRHRHRDGLCQIANELASKGLCHPLIPTKNADASAYLKAFLYRLNQSISSIRAKEQEGLLCVVVDASDNAEIAATEIGEPRSFVRDLVRMPLPEGVRLVALCRTHRQSFLQPPPAALSIELEPFSLEETAALLRQSFPDASDHDVVEFHRLSSRNPRVQSLALSRKQSLSETLRLLGPNPTTVEDTIGQILSESIAKLRDTVGPIGADQIDRMCAGLAALRPLIPISVLSEISGVDEGGIKSFAFDLGRPLIVTGDTIQFFDEPAETWFRERFRPDSESVANFVTVLRPLASKSAYVASVLPQLMLEARQFDGLVKMALSSESLPEGSPLEQRDIELQRLQFALKATLREKRYTDAAKLALKAGGETAGESRQRALLQENTDLAAVFIGSKGIQEIVSRRTFGSGWTGSHHAYEASLMSGNADLIGDARSRLRMAEEWLRNWAKLPQDNRDDEKVVDADIVELALAHLNIHGAASCVDSLLRWRPPELVYRVGRKLIDRLIDHGRYDDIHKLVADAGNSLCLLLAVTAELQDVCRTAVPEIVKRATRLILSTRVKLPHSSHWDESEGTLGAIVPLASSACRLGVADRGAIADLLTRYLPAEPPRGLSSRFGGSRFSSLRAYTLRATLQNNDLQLVDLAHPELRKELIEKNRHQDSRDAQEFKEDVGALLPWHKLWTRTLLREIPKSEIESKIAETLAASTSAQGIYHREESHTSDEIARLWAEILVLSGAQAPQTLDTLNQWAEKLKRPLFTPTLMRLARLVSAEPSLHKYALGYARKAFAITRDARDQADSKASGYIGVARSILTVSVSEAEAFFNAAVEVANKIGDENLDRWGAFLDLADKAKKDGRPSAEVAYKFSRCGELTYEYVARDKHFDWDATVRALRGLCPASSFAILSRWRDRHFGREERILPELVDSAIDAGNISALDAISLVGIRAYWEHAKLLRTALAACGADTNEQARVARVLHYYMRLEPHSAKTWSEVKAVLSEFGLLFQEIDDFIAYAKRSEKRRESREDKSWLSDRPEKTRDWDALFRDVDLTTANGIAEVNSRFRTLEPPFTPKDFHEAEFKRVPAGKEAEFIKAFGEVMDFDLYHLRNLLENLPEDWRGSPAVKVALAQTVKTYARRFCMGISKSRYYQVLPFRLIAELSGVDERELIEVVLTGVGETPELADAGRLFTLVGLLAVALSEDQALKALSFGLNLLDPILEEKDGDGPWTDRLRPPNDIETSLAGYMWAGLAAPDSAIRWEAAHCVVNACALGRSTLLQRLVEFAKANEGGPFVDAKLPFYDRHARLWFLVALSRSSRECATSVTPHLNFLVESALQGEPHILMRRFAADAALKLVDAGSAVPDEVKSKLANVNVSPFPPVKARDDTVDDGLIDFQPDKEDEYYFGLDVGPHWFAPLARCFGVSQQRVEHKALKLIRKDWKYTEARKWDADERARRGYYRDMSTHHSHGSYPRVDELSFYLSFHAMMVVAGDLLATKPVRFSSYSDGDVDRFDDWIRGHSLTRFDGYWLSDHREPTPPDWHVWKDEENEKTWKWSLKREDFDRVLRPADDRVNLWGYWSNVDGRRTETIHVASALVSRRRSHALLRALQTARNPHDFKIPDADDDLEINHGEFQLKGWVVAHHRDRELDRLDPWSGDISYPPPQPASRIKELLGLTSDIEKKVWHDEGQIRVLWSSTWGHFEEGEREEEAHETGNRLQGTKEFVVELLARTGMNLIVEVDINRSLRRGRYDSRDDNENHFEYIPSSARIFLFGPDGNYISI